MRRPPDKDGHPVSDRDVDTSNITLNTLFGGGQKPWMVGLGGAPIRPTPRTRTSSVPQVTVAQKSATHILSSPAPSDEPSPTLSHTTVNGAQTDGRRYREDSRRPSSSTITSPTQIQQPLSTEARAHSLQTVPDSLNRPPIVSNASHTQPRRPSTNTTSQSPIIMTDSIPPLPPSVLLPSDRQQAEQSSATAQSSPMQLQNVMDPQTNILPTLSGPVEGQAQGQQTSSATQGVQPRRTSQNPYLNFMQNNAASPRFDTGVSLTSEQPEARPFPAPGAIPANPQSDARTHNLPGATASPRKRQRIQAAAMPSLKGRVKLIEQHIQSAGGLLNLNTGLERPRFQLLTDACNQEDAFYVALHQVFCCWDVDRNQILSISGYPNIQALQLAFRILGQLIRENDALAPNHKKWFAEFPSPLRHLLQSSEPYRRTVGEVGIFLSRLASDWGALSHECTTRGYPPLTDELVTRMGLLSPILQSVVFTASRRNLGIRDEEVGTRMEDLFRRDQQEHQALSARYNTARPPTIREAQERNRALASEYIILHNQLIQRRHSSAVATPGSRVATPVLRNNDHPQPGITNQPPPVPQPQQTINQSSWNQNMPSPPVLGSQQFPNSIPPRIQQAPDISSSSPLPGNRPPSVGAQRSYTNTPSPTLLQGHSMHSPVQLNFPSLSIGRSNVQMHPQQIGSPQMGVQQNGPYYHTTIPQQVDPTMQQRAHTTPQQQHMMAQHQQQSNLQWAQNTIDQQTTTSMQQVAAQQQIRQELSRQVFNMNRSAQSRRDSHPIANHPQRNLSGNHTVLNNSHRPQGIQPGPRLPGQVAAAVPAEINAYTQKHPLQRSLIPPLNYVHPSQPLNPDVTALHQAHIRSPRLVPTGLSSSSTSQENPATRYYQTVRGFVLPPTRISSSSPLSKFDFTIPAYDLTLTPSDTKNSIGQVATREFRKGTLQYRLRCVQAKRTDMMFPIVDWVVEDTVWPEGASLAINKHQLEIRRKTHHGKDLPIDITPLVRLTAPNATNQITLSILRGRSKMKDLSYFLAVEVIEILHHTQILDMVYQNRISASYTLNKIKKSLSGDTGDDEDIAMVTSDLSIDLADPFTSKVFTTPVRGSSCLHRECFDLEVFLMTRNSKTKRPEQPSMVDGWKCPLCGKDARPYSLQVDDFLISVRSTLEEQGKLEHVKAILMDASGTWRPKVEKRKAASGSDDDSDYSSDGDGALMRASAAAKQRPAVKKVVEVIALDDD